MFVWSSLTQPMLWTFEHSKKKKQQSQSTVVQLDEFPSDWNGGRNHLQPKNNIGAGFHHHLIGFPAVSFSGGIHLNVGYKLSPPLKTQGRNRGFPTTHGKDGGVQPSTYGFFVITPRFSWHLPANSSTWSPTHLVNFFLIHQPRFPWNKGISLTTSKTPFGVRSCEVAIVWPDPLNSLPGHCVRSRRFHPSGCHPSGCDSRCYDPNCHWYCHYGPVPRLRGLMVTWCYTRMSCWKVGSMVGNFKGITF